MLVVIGGWFGALVMLAVSCDSNVVEGDAAADACPDEPPSIPGCGSFPDGLSCSFDVPCQSGTRELTFECEHDSPSDSGFDSWIIAEPCTHPYDSCPNTYYYCHEGEWLHTFDTRSDFPCPAVVPPDGGNCWIGDPGGSAYRCGYPCAGDEMSWTVVTCDQPRPYEMGTWEHDDACL